MKIIPFNLPEPASARATAVQNPHSARALEAPDLPSVRVVVAFPKPKFAARTGRNSVRIAPVRANAGARAATSARVADVILLQL